MVRLAYTLEYDVSTPPVIAYGISYTAHQLEQILSGPVKAILQDTTGQEELHGLLAGLVTTDFEHAELSEVLA
ncbi:hypothetical protein ACEV9J_24030, partial [Vibrio parahaemolyticus]